MESNGDYITKEYKKSDELKKELCRYHLTIDKTNFIVKKTEIILNELLKDNKFSKWKSSKSKFMGFI